jgi:hypothetical protein
MTHNESKPNPPPKPQLFEWFTALAFLLGGFFVLNNFRRDGYISMGTGGFSNVTTYSGGMAIFVIAIGLGFGLILTLWCGWAWYQNVRRSKRK